MKSLGVAAVIAVTALAACAATAISVQHPTDEEPAIQRVDLHTVAGDGDWVLARRTSAAPVSRAGLYDATRDALIEATDGTVREMPIADGAAIIVVRPANMTAVDRRDALARARSRIGATSPDDGAAFVAWASQTAARSGSGPAITFEDLMKYGEVVFIGVVEQVQAAR